MKRHDPAQGSLFGSDPQNPAPCPVPPERVAAELPGQLFLPIAPVTTCQGCGRDQDSEECACNQRDLAALLAPALPPLDVLAEARSIANDGPKGWEFYPGTGAPTYVRRLGRGIAVVKLWGGAAYWSAKRTDNAERTDGCESTQADAERAATAALERLVNSYNVP